MIFVRPAVARDAEAAVEVLRRSIIELCTTDHGNDPEILESWLANKTPDHFHDWLAAPGGVLAIAEREGAIAGVGGCRDDGEITLNYVSPDHRLAGVSTAIVAWLEDYLRQKGAARAHLTTTRMAHDFYRARGYVDEGDPIPWRGGKSVQTMCKVL